MHLRSKWIQKRLNGAVKPEHVSRISTDFMQVVRVMINKKLIKGRNISRYNYCVIRLCSRRGLELLKDIPDMKKSKTRQRFDNNLFGIVYKELRWNINCVFPYYLDWLKKT